MTSLLHNYLLIMFVVCLCINPAKAVISNGMNATDLLGQFDDVNGTVLNYNQGQADNGPNNIGFNSGWGGVEIDTVNHRLFVADQGNNRVLVFNLNADNTIPDYVADNVLGQPDFTSYTLATTQSGMYGPEGISYDSVNNRLFVAETGNNRVMVFDVTAITNGENAVNVLGQSDFVSAGFATSQAGMDGADSVIIDPGNNRLFVGDFDNNRVLVFDVAVITNGENAVNVLGQANFTTNTTAASQSKFNNQSGLAYDSVGQRLFVADSVNNRVMVFDVNAITNGENAVNVLGQTNFTNSGAATTQSRMSGPEGLGYDSANKRLFVNDAGNNRALIFDVNAIRTYALDIK